MLNDPNMLRAINRVFFQQKLGAATQSPLKMQTEPLPKSPKHGFQGAVNPFPMPMPPKGK